MPGYRWRDPGRWKQAPAEPEIPAQPAGDPPIGRCVFCGTTGPVKSIRGRDPVCVDDEACMARGWAGLENGDG